MSGGPRRTCYHQQTATPAASAIIHAYRRGGFAESAGFRRTSSRNRLQRKRQIQRRLKPFLRLLLQTPANHPIEHRRQRRVQIRRLLLQNRVHHFNRGVPGEGPFSRHHLVQHHAQAEQIRACVGHLPAHLLRRHIADRAQHHAGIGLDRLRGKLGGMCARWFRAQNVSPVRSRGS